MIRIKDFNLILETRLDIVLSPRVGIHTKQTASNCILVFHRPIVNTNGAPS